MKVVRCVGRCLSVSLRRTQCFRLSLSHLFLLLLVPLALLVLAAARSRAGAGAGAVALTVAAVAAHLRVFFFAPFKEISARFSSQTAGMGEKEGWEGWDRADAYRTPRCLHATHACTRRCVRACVLCTVLVRACDTQPPLHSVRSFVVVVVRVEGGCEVTEDFRNEEERKKQVASFFCGGARQELKGGSHTAVYLNKPIRVKKFKQSETTSLSSHGSNLLTRGPRVTAS